MSLNNPSGAVTIATGDIEIGAVELKNGTDDTRAVIDATYGLATDIKRIAAGTAMIGHVITDTGSTTAVTGNVASTVADGANVTQGTTTDAAVVTDANGTVSGKLRGLVKIFSDVWDSSLHMLKVKSYADKTFNNTATPLGANDTYTLILDSLSYSPNYRISVWTDQAGTWQTFVSDDNITYYPTIASTVQAATTTAASSISVNSVRRYLKYVYTNGATPQAAFSVSIVQNTII